jgi:hypothetical protein
MKNFLQFNMREPKEGECKISYSQFSMYSTCPKHWELAYVKGLRTFNQSIHTLFGTCLHETLQEYLTVMYTESIKKADSIDFKAVLKDKMFTQYKEAMEQMGKHFSNKFELNEFYDDGVAILEWIRKRRAEYFSSKHEELVGIEVPIYHPVGHEGRPVFMMGFLDVVIRNNKTNRITILDIKTSGNGWNKYQKADKLKASQLVLYKEYFGEQFGIDKESIDIKYFIVKRKLIEGAMFPQKRVQEFIPASGKPTRKKLLTEINAFVESSFKEDGSYNTEREYPAIAGKNYKNCKYCEFAEDDELCPMKNRIKLK